MDKIVVSMVNSSYKVNKTAHPIELILFYSCPKHSECSSMSFHLPRGKYFIECFGAGGGSLYETGSTTQSQEINGIRTCIDDSIVNKFGGNTKCNPYNNAGSGAYISGYLTLKETTHIYARIGGSGEYVKNAAPKGGFNGGAHGGNLDNGCSSGGGATDLRVGVDDYFHRIIVSGGGGGTDDLLHDSSSFFNEGDGGSGGYPEAQGYWINGEYQGEKVTNQTNGFSFGQGQATPITNHDACGAGGGWFGGFASNHANGGCGGGSSFILTKNATVPTSSVIEKTENGETVKTSEYAFSSKTKYLFEDIAYANGIWSGHGKIRIILVNELKISCKRSFQSLRLLVSFMVLISY
jgi:hypothetical protein